VCDAALIEAFPARQRRATARSKCHDGEFHHHHGETMAVVRLTLKAAGWESLIATLTKIIRFNTLLCLGPSDRDIVVATSGSRILSV
jgi:hypothetical protein